MIILITGGSGSGKSAYAEEYITELSEDCRKYYIATMQVFDKEGQRKVLRHREMREGKGFWTIEQPADIEEAGQRLADCDEECTALLECMSNLVANEMFGKALPKKSGIVTEKIIRGVEKLSGKFKHLVIVTNNVFEDGIVYDEATMEYIKAMGVINVRLAEMADKVIEVVVGIPVIVKEGRLYAYN